MPVPTQYRGGEQSYRLQGGSQGERSTEVGATAQGPWVRQWMSGQEDQQGTGPSQVRPTPQRLPHERHRHVTEHAKAND